MESDTQKAIAALDSLLRAIKTHVDDTREYIGATHKFYGERINALEKTVGDLADTLSDIQTGVNTLAADAANIRERLAAIQRYYAGPTERGAETRDDRIMKGAGQ